MQLLVTFLHEVEASYWLENPSESYTNIEISYSHFSMFPNFQLSTKTSFIAQKRLTHDSRKFSVYSSWVKACSFHVGSPSRSTPPRTWIFSTMVEKYSVRLLPKGELKCKQKFWMCPLHFRLFFL